MFQKRFMLPGLAIVGALLLGACGVETSRDVARSKDGPVELVNANVERRGDVFVVTGQANATTMSFTVPEVVNDDDAFAVGVPADGVTPRTTCEVCVCDGSTCWCTRKRC